MKSGAVEDSRLASPQGTPACGIRHRLGRHLRAGRIGLIGFTGFAPLFICGLIFDSGWARNCGGLFMWIFTAIHQFTD